MRCSDIERLGPGLLAQFVSPAQSGAQNSVDQWTVFLPCNVHGFVNGGVLGSLKNKQLIKAKSKNIPKINIDGCSSETADPEIEQGQIAQDAVEQLDREGAIRSAQRRAAEQL